MNTFLGKPQQPVADWFIGQLPTEKVTLTVYKAYDTDVGSQAALSVDGVPTEFGVPTQLDKGKTVSLRAFPPENYAVEHFLYWSDDPEHATYSSDRTLSVNQDISLTAMFHANVS